MTITIEIACAVYPPTYIRNLIKKNMRKSIRELQKENILAVSKNCFLSIYFTHSKETQELNKTYRNKNKIADILSFPNANEMNPYERHLGDLVFACDTIKQDAIKKNITLEKNYLHLACHGLLHLCGFDHVDDAAHATMIDMEIKLLRKLGYDNPYELKY